MVIMDEMVRAMGFIDFENINIPARQQVGVSIRLNFNKLAELMLQGYTRSGCSVYLPDEMRHLSTDISKQGLKPVLVSPGKSVDGRLILDLLVNAQNNKFDVAVIASGDRDYIDVIQAVHQLNKKVKIVSFQSNLGPGLRAVVRDEDITILESHINAFVLKPQEYKCSNCGKNFTLPFKLYPNQLPPKCSDCRRGAVSVKRT